MYACVQGKLAREEKIKQERQHNMCSETQPKENSPKGQHITTIDNDTQQTSRLTIVQDSQPIPPDLRTFGQYRFLYNKKDNETTGAVGLLISRHLQPFERNIEQQQWIFGEVIKASCF